MAFYAVMKHDTRDDTIHVFKCPAASDPNTITNWTSQATYVFDGQVKSIWVVVDSSDLHILVAGERIVNQDAGGFCKYVRYDVATDAIDIDEEDTTAKLGSFSTRQGDPPALSDNFFGVTGTVRSDGDVVSIFTDVGGGLVFNPREGGTWSSSKTAINAATSAISGVAVLGGSDLTHVFYFVAILDDVHHRSISSSNALGTESTIDAAATVTMDSALIGTVTFNDGTARVRIAWVNSADAVNTAYGNDTANPSWTVESDASDNDIFEINEHPIGDLVLDGQVSHIIYSEAASFDIFRDENDGIGGWGTDTEEKDAVTCNAMSANVYNRSGQKLAYLWDDAGTTKYNEVSLAAAVERVPVSRQLQQVRSPATRGIFAA